MKEIKSRLVTPKLIKYLKLDNVLVITGMRRVGKTTLLKYLFEFVRSKNKVFFDLEDVLVRKIFTEDNYENVVLALEQEGFDFKSKGYIFIDEIQFVRNIPSVIKYLYDKYGVKFVVTGSSSFYLKNYFSESLSGRKIVVDLHPLTFLEFLKFKGVEKIETLSYKQKSRKKIELSVDKFGKLYQEYARFGGLPGVVLTKGVEQKKLMLRDVANSYFQIDVATLMDFKDVGVLRDLLALLTQRVGQKLNIVNLANVLKIRRDKVYSYLEFLQSTFMVKFISQKTSIDNRVSADNKVYFTDTGLAQVFEKIALGSLLENSVYMSLAYEEKLSYFQTKSGGEIDFVVNNKIGLEVKQSPSPQDIANLKKRLMSAKLKEGYVVGVNYLEKQGVVMAWDL